MMFTWPAEISPIGFHFMADIITQFKYFEDHKDQAQSRTRLITICFTVVISPTVGHF